VLRPLRSTRVTQPAVARSKWALGAADAGIVIFLDYFPTTPLGDLAQLPKLIFDSLLFSRYANVDSRNCRAPLMSRIRSIPASYHSVLVAVVALRKANGVPRVTASVADFQLLRSMNSAV
jgi:hypothetical protein